MRGWWFFYRSLSSYFPLRQLSPKFRSLTSLTTMRTSWLNTDGCARPCAGPAMGVVQFWRSAVQTDLQDNSITGQRSHAFRAPPSKQHSFGQRRGRGDCSARKQNLADVFQQKRLASGHEDFFDAKLP